MTSIEDKIKEMDYAELQEAWERQNKYIDDGCFGTFDLVLAELMAQELNMRDEVMAREE